MLVSLHRFSVPPLIYYTLATIIGITWSMHAPSSFLLVHGTAITILIFFYFSNHHYSIKKVLTIAFFLLGSFAYQRHTYWYTFWQNFMQNNALNITLTIVDEDTKQHSFLRHVYTGKIKEIMCTQTGKRFYPDYTILLYSYKRLPIAIGNSIKVFNYSFGKKSANPIDHFLKKEGIIGTIVKKTFDFGVCSYNKYSLENITHIYRKHHLKKLRKKLHTLSYQLYSLMFLGKKPFNTQGLLQVKQYCKTWGILHHLARSGLHLVACIFTWEKMLRYIPVHTFIKHILLLLFSFIYYLLSWPSISFARSMLVFLFYKMAALSNNQVLSIHIMSLITLLVLLHNPHVLSFLDFQLSFGITFLLTWINHVTLLRMRRSIKIIAN